MEILSKRDVAGRAGVEPDYVDTLVSLEIFTPDENGLFTAGAARATRVIRDLERGGLPVAGIAEAVKAGLIDLGLFDLGNYDRIAALTADTFRETADRTGIPLHLLLVLREAIGFAVADPEDRMREDESEVIPFIQSGLAGGLPAEAIERVLRVYGESLRRMVETESEAWVTHVVMPLIGSGMPAQQVFEVLRSSARPAWRSSIRPSWPSIGVSRITSG